MQKVRITVSHMTSSLEDEAIKIARQALTKHSQNDKAAWYIREEFDKKYG